METNGDFEKDELCSDVVNILQGKDDDNLFYNILLDIGREKFVERVSKIYKVKWSKLKNGDILFGYGFDYNGDIIFYNFTVTNPKLRLLRYYQTAPVINNNILITEASTKYRIEPSVIILLGKRDSIINKMGLKRLKNKFNFRIFKCY